MNRPLQVTPFGVPLLLLAHHRAASNCLDISVVRGVGLEKAARSAAGKPGPYWPGIGKKTRGSCNSAG